MMKSYRLQFKSYKAKVTQVKIKSYYSRLTCPEQFENSSRFGMLRNRDPDPHIRIVQSDRGISKYVLGA